MRSLKRDTSFTSFFKSAIPLGQALIAITQLPVKRTRAADIKSVTFSLFGLMHLIKCGLAAVILSMRIPRDVLYVKKNYDHHNWFLLTCHHYLGTALLHLQTQHTIYLTSLIHFLTTCTLIENSSKWRCKISGYPMYQNTQRFWFWSQRWKTLTLNCAPTVGFLAAGIPWRPLLSL